MMQLPMLNATLRRKFLIGVAFLATCACSSKADRAATAFAQAQQYIGYGNMRDAKRELLVAVAAREDVPEIWSTLGDVRLKTGDLPGAYAAFTRADELRPGDAGTLRSIAFTAYMIGALDQSQAATDRLLALAGDDPQGLAVKGLLALDRGEPETTLTAAETILASAPGDDTGVMLKARAIAVKGNLPDAVTLLQSQIKASSGQSGVDMALLQLYRAQHDAPRMLALFPDLLERRKGDVELGLDYANVLYRTGNITAGRKIWSDTVLATASDGKMVGWAFELYELLEPQDGPPILDERILRAPPSPLRSAAAQYLIQHKDFARAIAVLTQGKNVVGADRGLYALALDGLGRRNEAKPLVENLLSETSGPQDTNALVLRGRWALEARQLERARADMQNAIVADPTNLDARLLLARSYQVDAQPLRVRQVLAEAVKNLPRSRRALLTYVQFLQTIGDNDSAVAVAGDYVDANATDPWGWNMMSATCAKVGKASCMARAQQRRLTALTDYSFTNPYRPFKLRGLFAPLPSTA